MRYLVLLCILFFVSCSDIKKEAEDAVNQGDFITAALKYAQLYNEEADPAIKKQYLELSSIYNIRREIEKSKTSKKINAIEAQMNKAMEKVTEPSDNYNKMYADLMPLVADAYLNAKANNKNQEKEYKNKAVQVLEDALALFPDAENAKTKLAEIRKVDYEEAIQKAKSYYEEYEKNKKQNEGKLVYAESWYSKALQYKPDDSETAKILDGIRKLTMKIPEIEETIMIACGAFVKKEKTYLFKVWLRNNSNNPADFDQENFTVTMSDGSEVKPDEALTSKSVGAKELLKAGPFAVNKEIIGTFAITSSGGSYPVKLTYNDGEYRSQFKNLPIIK